MHKFKLHKKNKKNMHESPLKNHASVTHKFIVRLFLRLIESSVSDAFTYY